MDSKVDSLGFDKKTFSHSSASCLTALRLSYLAFHSQIARALLSSGIETQSLSIYFLISVRVFISSATYSGIDLSLYGLCMSFWDSEIRSIKNARRTWSNPRSSLLQS